VSCISEHDPARLGAAKSNPILSDKFCAPLLANASGKLVQAAVVTGGGRQTATVKSSAGCSSDASGEYQCNRSVEWWNVWIDNGASGRDGCFCPACSSNSRCRAGRSSASRSCRSRTCSCRRTPPVKRLFAVIVRRPAAQGNSGERRVPAALL